MTWMGATFGMIALLLTVHVSVQIYYTIKFTIRVNEHTKEMDGFNKRHQSVKDFTLLMCKLKLMRHEDAWLVEINYLSNMQIELLEKRKSQTPI